MDFLKVCAAPDDSQAEIEKKKQALQNAQEKVGEKKYLKRGELERLRELDYLREQEQLEKEKDSKRAKKMAAMPKAAPASPAKADTAVLEPQPEMGLYTLDDKEIKARLRAKGHPTTLFGESREDRIKRLQLEESMEQRAKPITFKNLLEKAEKELNESLFNGLEAAPTFAKPGAVDDLDINTDGISIELVKNDRDLACDLMLAYYRKVLREWGLYLQSRPEEVKRSPQGKLQAVTYSQTIEHLKPFWKGLQKKTLASDIMERMADIAKHMQDRQYMLANDTYIRLSIGNAPWPIGVTSSGIHERAGDDKIKTSEVAHVLNDEVARKWIQGIKRLMTFAEEKWPAGL
ncbi:mRNA splicing protein prp18 [Kappamyces sp. JEL0829]|nr:mRNA splicing protein prp18 [Kappamyces sp. JEL0829]